MVGAGDIANCDIASGAGAQATARLLDRIPGTVFTLGDHAYPSGNAKQFKDCYDSSWGRHKARTRPSPGNHDYLTGNGKPYYDYFGDSAGPERRGYYSYKLGAWHIVSLNSFIAIDRDSNQIEWLRKDLSENHTACTLAYWHTPAFSSGPHGSEPQTTARVLELWRVLYEFGADVVLNGHDHDYERFAPQDPKGKPDPKKGIRQFVVGTGGYGLGGLGPLKGHSEIRQNTAFGVLELTLHPAGYDWRFIPEVAGAFADSGSGV